MSLQIFGDLVLALFILAAPIIFAVANANYLPDTEGGDEDGTQEEAHS